LTVLPAKPAALVRIELVSTPPPKMIKAHFHHFQTIGLD